MIPNIGQESKEETAATDNIFCEYKDDRENT